MGFSKCNLCFLPMLGDVAKDSAGLSAATVRKQRPGGTAGQLAFSFVLFIRSGTQGHREPSTLRMGSPFSCNSLHKRHAQCRWLEPDSS